MTRRRGWGFGLDMSQTLIRPSRLADSMLDKSEMVIFWRGRREALPSRYQRPCQIYDTPSGLFSCLSDVAWPARCPRLANTAQPSPSESTRIGQVGWQGTPQLPLHPLAAARGLGQSSTSDHPPRRSAYLES
jgi:hypothetical protein